MRPIFSIVAILGLGLLLPVHAQRPARTEGTCNEIARSGSGTLTYGETGTGQNEGGTLGSSGATTIAVTLR